MRLISIIIEPGFSMGYAAGTTVALLALIIAFFKFYIIPQL